MAMMVAISTAKCMLASRIPCCTFQSSCWYPGSSCLAPSPPPPLASHFSYNPAILSMHSFLVLSLTLHLSLLMARSPMLSSSSQLLYLPAPDSLRCPFISIMKTSPFTVPWGYLILSLYRVSVFSNCSTVKG